MKDNGLKGGGKIGFDDLKDPRYHYHLSHEEMERFQRRADLQTAESQPLGLRKMLSKGTLRLLIFYATILVVFSFYAYLPRLRNASKSVASGDARETVIQVVDQDGRRGLNILLRNASDQVWTVPTILLQQGAHRFDTNVHLEIAAGAFEVLFIPLEWKDLPGVRLTLPTK